MILLLAALMVSTMEYPAIPRFRFNPARKLALFAFLAVVFILFYNWHCCFSRRLSSMWDMVLRARFCWASWPGCRRRTATERRLPVGCSFGNKNLAPGVKIVYFKVFDIGARERRFFHLQGGVLFQSFWQGRS